ncbi:ABC transporter permease [Aeromicrobium sp. 9AM]|uniref:ABC transporter permease n=1 Tax=Aeromicrobium sp. 9AM TaxID=2653126 RepID=UPI0012F31B59|nr:FtsX-like permease family protein [Aeromicrobium sp. 9AM]VXC12265.1 ABC transporter permease [Aeromicrobium sp. 9AM]
MLRFTLRNVMARKVRLLLSALAIVLGVGFLSGSLVFTDTMGKSFDNIIGGSIADASVRLTGIDRTSLSAALNIDQRTLPASLVSTVASAPGVARADGSVYGQGMFVVKANGKLLGGTGAPTMALNFNDAPNASGEPTVTIARGRAPEKTGEVVLDQRSAENAGYEIGDTVRMVTAGDQPRVAATLVGYADFAGGGLAGATMVLFDTRTAQDLFMDGKDAYTSIELTADKGVSQEQLVKAVEPLLPKDAEAVTGKHQADEFKSVVDTVLGYLNTFLLVFAAIALVVGSFLIVNTFSILVAQRSRELAILRALGASRGQVARSVLAEAVVVGLLGASAGLALGFGLATGLRAVFASFGLDLSATSLVFSARTILVSYVVGVTVTMFAAYLPARRAARVAPVEAMRDGTARPERSLRRRWIVGTAMAVLGGTLVTTGLMGDGGWGAAQVGLGMFTVLMAIAVMSPAIAVPVLAPLGALYARVFGTTGRLATQNSLRNPGRTAATASALMIGLALVTTISILAASVSASIDSGIDEQFTSDFLISNAIGQSFSPSIADDVRHVDGVGVIAPAQLTSLKVDGDQLNADATDSRALEQIFHITYVSGDAAVGDREIALMEDRANALGVKVGDDVTLSFASGDLPSRVTGIYQSTYVVADAVIPFSTLTAAKVQRADTSIAVNAEPGADKAALARDLDAATADFPTVTVQNKDDFAEAQRGQVDQLLYLIYALLGLAIVIAALGIVNTLALSIVERTREIGVLRAVGLSRRQLRRMVRLEAIAISLLGAVLGIGAGLLFGVILQQIVKDQGITDLAVPWVRLVVFIAVATVVGVLAAVLPARRAAGLNVLRAISTH